MINPALSRIPRSDQQELNSGPTAARKLMRRVARNGVCAATVLLALSTAGCTVINSPAEPFWRGLERHEIPLAQTLLLVKGSRGVIACPYLNIDTFIKTGEVAAIVPARNIEAMLSSHVTAVTPAAQRLGITVGMSGREALERIR